MKNILVALERISGAPAVADVLATLSPASRTLVEGPVLVSSWFPMSVSSEIHLGIRQTVGKGTWDVNRLVGQEAARIDFQGIYKVFLRLMDYDATLDRLDGAWRQYNSQGHVRWPERHLDHATCEVVEVEGFNEGQWVSIGGRLEVILTLCGAKRVEVEVTRAWPTECRALLRWQR